MGTHQSFIFVKRSYAKESPYFVNLVRFCSWTQKDNSYFCIWVTQTVRVAIKWHKTEGAALVALRRLLTFKRIGNLHTTVTKNGALNESSQLKYPELDLLKLGEVQWVDNHLVIKQERCATIPLHSLYRFTTKL
jgi:hypothetical protein